MHKNKYILMVIGLIFCVEISFPVFWALFTSFKTTHEIVGYPPTLFPHNFTLDHYVNAIVGAKMGKYFFNTIIVAIGAVVLTLVIGCHAGYAASRFSFPGKSAIMMVILISGMIPGIAVLVPLYMTATRLNLTDTFFALIMVYGGWRLFITVWLLRAFFDQIPRDLEEAALIDGCSRIQAFYRIILPLTQPGLAATAIMTFVLIWNDFIRAYALTTKSNMWLVQVGLFQFRTTYGINWGQLMAAVIFVSTPIIVMFVSLQSRFIEGLTAGATKG
jgi:ABC-type glycerol-3-phosphate transport system permease component